MLRRILLLCFFISGATGLVYEVVWARYLTVFIGGTAMAHTIVLATFMGGLALGNAWIGKWANRVTNKLLLYAFLEFGIGLVCLVFPEFFALLGKAYVAMAAGSTPGSISLTLLKTVLAIVAILPPCVLMGGTLPVLTKAIVGQLSKVGTRIGLIYAINTAGALAGIFLAGFVLLEQFGLSMSIRISAVANIVLGLIFYLLSRSHSAGAVGADSEDDSGDDSAFEYSSREIRWTVAIAALSGMFTMILEVVWIRLVAVVMGSSTYSFSIMLLGFIGGLCIGGAVVSVIMRRDRDAVPILVAVLSGLAAVLVLIIPFYEQLPYFFNILNSWFEDRQSGFVLFLGGQVCFVMLLTLVPTTLIGMVLPLATRVATQLISVLGATVGSVFSINTIGTLIGAALGGLVLIPNLGLDVTYRVVACGNALMAFLLWIMVGRPRSKPHKLRATAGLVLAVTVLMLIPQWNKIVLTVGVFRNGPRRVASSFEEFKNFYSGRELLFYEDGRDDTITVIRMPNGQTDMVVNAKSDATDGADMMTQRLIGQVGMILRPHSRNVFVVGLGSGVSMNSVLTHPVDSVDVVEISESVMRASDYFKHVNNNALGDPRVTLHVADAKEVLKLNPDKKWDLVVSQPTNPWIVGVGSLFAEEYWRDIQTHMVEDGLLVQWVQNYEMNDPLQEIIFQTFDKVFPHTSVLEVDNEDMALIGSMKPIKIDVEAIKERMALPKVAAELNDVNTKFQVQGIAAFLAMEVVSDGLFRARFPGVGKLNTDDRPRLEFLGPKALYEGKLAKILRGMDGRRRAHGGDRMLDQYRAQVGPLSDLERLEIAQMFKGMRSALGKPQYQSLVWDAYRRGGAIAELFAKAKLDPPPLPPKFPTERKQLIQLCAQQLERVVGAVVTWSGIFHDAGSEDFAALVQVCAESPQTMAGLSPALVADALIRIGDGKSALKLMQNCEGNAVCHVARVYALNLMERGKDAATELAQGLANYPDDVELKYLSRVCDLGVSAPHCVAK